MKVDFILLGTAKAGTSTMAEILRNHLDISFCKKKEPEFFCRSKNWREELSKYHSLFEESEGKIYGEASHSYTALPQWNLNIWEDIYEYNKNMKFIYIVRNPIDRFISSYMQNYQKGDINYSIEESLRKGDSINRSRYYTQIKPYIDLFGNDKIFIVSFKDFINNRNQVIKDIANFLNISYNEFKEYEEAYENVSVNSIKLHRKYDNLVKFLSPVSGFIPKNIKSIVKKNITNPKRIFKEKPKLTLKQQQTIINLTKLDTLELSKLIDEDLSDWLTVNEKILK